MATQRYVSTSFWDDEWIQTLDPSEKLLFLYYMTCPLTNISGVYKITPRRVSFDTGFTPDTIGHIMEKFGKAKKVYRHGEYIVIPSWPNHQKWESAPRIKDGIMANLRDMDEELLQFLVAVHYKFDLASVFDTLGIPYPYPSNYSDLDSDLDSDIDLGKSVANVPPTKSAKPLSRPTIQEVTDYCKDRGNNVDPQKWFDHYSSNGWKVGRNSMKDWKAAVRTWERSSFSTAPKNDEPMTDEQRRERVNQILRGTGV